MVSGSCNRVHIASKSFLFVLLINSQQCLANLNYSREEVGAQRFVRSLFSGLILLPTQGTIIGFWEAPVKCDELLPCQQGAGLEGLGGGGGGGSGDNKDRLEFVLKGGGDLAPLPNQDV